MEDLGPGSHLHVLLRQQRPPCCEYLTPSYSGYDHRLSLDHMSLWYANLNVGSTLCTWECSGVKVVPLEEMCRPIGGSYNFGVRGSHCRPKNTTNERDYARVHSDAVGLRSFDHSTHQQQQQQQRAATDTAMPPYWPSMGDDYEHEMQLRFQYCRGDGPVSFDYDDAHLPFACTLGYWDHSLMCSKLAVDRAPNSLAWKREDPDNEHLTAYINVQDVLVHYDAIIRTDGQPCELLGVRVHAVRGKLAHMVADFIPGVHDQMTRYTTELTTAAATTTTTAVASTSKN